MGPFFFVLAGTFRWCESNSGKSERVTRNAVAFRRFSGVNQRFSRANGE